MFQTRIHFLFIIQIHIYFIINIYLTLYLLKTNRHLNPFSFLCWRFFCLNLFWFASGKSWEEGTCQNWIEKSCMEWIIKFCLLSSLCISMPEIIQKHHLSKANDTLCQDTCLVLPTIWDVGIRRNPTFGLVSKY